MPKWTKQCAMCGRRGERSFKRERLLNSSNTVVTVCANAKSCRERYKERRRLAELEPCARCGHDQHVGTVCHCRCRHPWPQIPAEPPIL